MSSILLVEDNEELNEINRRMLVYEGYEVLTARTLVDARKLLSARKPDVILLDVIMPDGDGIDFCGEIRETTDAHILFLTSKDADVDRIRGLDSGGDDYITKPYKLEEMLSRVRAALRRRSMGVAQVPVKTLTLGPLTLDTVAMRGYLNGEDLLLKPKEFAILRLLVENEGDTIPGETLYLAAWKQPMFNDGNALWTQISRLKKKLKPEASLVLRSSRREGYMLQVLR